MPDPTHYVVLLEDDPHRIGFFDGRDFTARTPGEAKRLPQQEADAYAARYNASGYARHVGFRAVAAEQHLVEALVLLGGRIETERAPATPHAGGR